MIRMDFNNFQIWVLCEFRLIEFDMIKNCIAYQTPLVLPLMNQIQIKYKHMHLYVYVNQWIKFFLIGIRFGRTKILNFILSETLNNHTKIQKIVNTTFLFIFLQLQLFITSV